MDGIIYPSAPPQIRCDTRSIFLAEYSWLEFTFSSSRLLDLIRLKNPGFDTIYRELEVEERRSRFNPFPRALTKMKRKVSSRICLAEYCSWNNNQCTKFDSNEVWKLLHILNRIYKKLIFTNNKLDIMNHFNLLFINSSRCNLDI